MNEMQPLEAQEFEHRPPPAPGWMITFADLLSLLLAFFVLMFATTSVEQKDWQRVVQPISTYLTGRTIAPPQSSETPPVGKARLDLDYVAALLERLAADSKPLAGATVERAEHMVLFHLPAAAMTGPPTALGDLARLLASFDNRVEIRVHGVPDPDPHAAPMADWRRVLARAVAVSDELARLGGVASAGASATIDLTGAPADERIVILVHDSAEASHAAP
ncbi:MAG TPA: flagellar motor protein MotB [Aliidongia sp.]|nr:flagellar motor protein MotB [Aliidongia sp.]